MDKKLKTKWVKALRSGKVQQYTPAIMGYEDGSGAYCCLGVLGRIVMNQVTCHLRPNFEKAGLTSKQIDRLIEMNDKGRTFKQIAAYVERYV